MQPCGAACAVTARHPRRAAAGFSLVELVVVLVVAGLLAVVAVPRFVDRDVFEQRAYRDEIVAALRYARNLAIASGCPVRATLNAGSYALHQQSAAGGHCNPADTTWNVSARLPDGQPAAAVAPTGVMLAPPVSVIFDPAGRPDIGGDLLLTVGGSGITLHSGSGFVTP